ncbi:MAG TPA: hypothetical protein VEI02_16070 [Planctomycetota bacterium]|nr:hypothetical protein [Planctomycetota bacterium]
MNTSHLSAWREGFRARFGAAPPWKKTRLELVVGSDREIGRATRSQERRVGVTPPQVAELIAAFRDVGARLDVLVLENAGARAGAADAHYVDAGAEILAAEEVAWHDGPPDVVHALKEPSRYEADFPGPFLRIGALHLGDFHDGSGFARLLAKGDVGVFDGSYVGDGRWRVPIRGRMSVFAGEIAAEWCEDHLRMRGVRGRAVVVGAGRVGVACAAKLARGPHVDGLDVFEPEGDADRLAQVRAVVERIPGATLRTLSGSDDPRFLAAVGGAQAIVFGVAAAGARAPKVVRFETLRRAAPEGAVVVDVSIDERGAIDGSAAGVGDRDSSDRIAATLAEAFRPIVYRALPNMPRAYPREASAAHGEVILPYLATLLAACGLEGGPAAALDAITRTPRRLGAPDPASTPAADRFAAFVQDLRNGLAVRPTAQGPSLAGFVPAADRALIAAFLGAQGRGLGAPLDPT